MEKMTKTAHDQKRNKFYNLSLKKKIDLKKESQQFKKDHPEIIIKKLSHKEKREARKINPFYIARNPNQRNPQINMIREAIQRNPEMRKRRFKTA